MIDSNKLVEICQAIGDVAESNSLFTSGLTRRIGERDLEQMTVGELLAAIREHTEAFNKIYGAI